MKIDNHRAGFEAISKVTDAQTGAAKAAKGERTVGSDSVSLSNGVKFANTAMVAASGAPEIRREKVERAKALLESGQLGADPYKLADALIDKAIKFEK